MRRVLTYSVILMIGALLGCRQDMHDQPKYQAFERNAFFDDRRASRPLVPGTIARGGLEDDALFYRGEVDGRLADDIPLAVDRALLDRGRQRYDIFCSPCHDRVGTGNGMIVQRGYKKPPSLHEERLRIVSDGYFFQAIGNGFGVMPPYRAQVPPADRWAIVAYIRALQLSQNAPLSAVPAAARQELESAEASR